MQTESLLQAMERTVQAKRNDTFAMWYDDKGKETERRSFGQVWDEAGVVAHHLRNVWHVQKGERVVLCYDFGLHFFSVFIGCLRAGVTAVLVYPPNPPLTKSLPVLTKIVDDCSPRLVLTCNLINRLRLVDRRNPASRSKHSWPDIDFKVTESLKRVQGAGSFPTELYAGDDVPFLQYTSGSTAEPKGVRVTNTALVTNISILTTGFQDSFATQGGVPSDMTGCMWLPQYHDMGLLLTLQPFLVGWKLHLMSPISFIKNPPLWMELLSRTRSHWSCCPTFAIRLTARKFLERKGTWQNNLDLSALRRIQVCAEPVQPGTKEIFDAAFAEHRLRDDWVKVGYGLAEHVVGVSYVLGEHMPIIDGNVVASKVIASGSRHTLHPSITMTIVDPHTRKEVQDGQIGELWLSGPSVTGGYEGKSELSKETFQATLEQDTGTRDESLASPQYFLRTGDLGFFDDNGHLFIKGRIKDLIIVNGVNYAPQDIEMVVQGASEAVRPGCVAAFSSSDTDDDLVIVFELREASQSKAVQVTKQIHKVVALMVGLVPSQLVAIRERSIPKTTSGKIRRRHTRAALNEGTLMVLFKMRDIKSRLSKTFVLPDEIPSQFPASLCNVISSLTVDEEMLETYFRQLDLETLPGIREAWNAADKSQQALHELCESSLKAVQANFPTWVQFANLLQNNHDDWILEGGASDKLARVVHCMFVLHWVTEKLVPNGPDEASLLAQKIQQDDEAEQLLVAELGLESKTLPDEYSFLCDGRTTDGSYGVISAFSWLKQRSVRHSARFLVSRSGKHNYYESDSKDWYSREAWISHD